MTDASRASNRSAALQGAGLKLWFDGVAGSALAAEEASLAAEELADLFGYHVLQVGRPHGVSLLAASRIGHHAVLDAEPGDAGLSAFARADALPVQSGTIDVVVLPHALEFADDPYGVLREAERVLIPEGHLLLFGFNPWSLYGAWRLAAGWRGEFPWRGRFYSAGRVKDWLAVLGFEIVRYSGLSFRPPLSGERLFSRLAWMERPGRYFLPLVGNVYWLLARKRVPAPRPIRALRARRRRVRTAAVAESPLGQRRDGIEDPDHD